MYSSPSIYTEYEPTYPWIGELKFTHLINNDIDRLWHRVIYTLSWSGTKFEVLDIVVVEIFKNLTHNAPQVGGGE